MFSQAWNDRELSLDAALETLGDAAVPATLQRPEEWLGQVEQLHVIGTLPIRQQRLLWLQGLGLSYAEMARHESCTPRTVERQLLRARGAIRGEDRAD